MRRYFCTYFDHRYLSRGLAMYLSLKQHCPSAKVWVLCLSDECYRTIVQLDWPDLIPIPLEAFEKGDEELLAAKKNRSTIEYYFTCTPSLPLFVLKRDTSIDLISYIDSDLYFFNDTESIFREIGTHSIAIIPHRFPPKYRHLERTGIFNVGWLTFRRDDEGMACLTWWRDRCLEWCYDYPEDDRYADQKYLDQFPKRFANLRVIEHKGANVAAWNLGNYTFRERDETLWVDDQPLVFYHFNHLRKIAPGVVDPSIRQYDLKLSWTMEWKLFRPYLQKLIETRKMIEPILTSGGSLTNLYRKLDKNDTGKPKRYSARAIARFLAAYLGLVTRKFLLSPGF